MVTKKKKKNKRKVRGLRKDGYSRTLGNENSNCSCFHRKKITGLFRFRTKFLFNKSLSNAMITTSRIAKVKV